MVASFELQLLAAAAAAAAAAAGGFFLVLQMSVCGHAAQPDVALRFCLPPPVPAN